MVWGSNPLRSDNSQHDTGKFATGLYQRSAYVAWQHYQKELMLLHDIIEKVHLLL